MQIYCTKGVFLISGNNSLGVLMLDIEGMELSAEDKNLLANPQVGGVILGLFGRNFSSITQLQKLIVEIRQCNQQLLIAVDQEGGRVQRFQDGFTRLPAMHVFEEYYKEDSAKAAELVETCGWLMAAEVLSCGLDLSFAPVLDLYSHSSRVIADRAFAADARVVTDLATAFITGMHRAGMRATGKHFPGHGTVDADSHVELPVDPRPIEELFEADLLPFVNCSKVLDAVMPGHVLYSAVDNNCAALSKVWLQEILRNQLNFSGIVFSDDLGMAAAGTVGNAVKRAQCALEAGCDMILVCNNRQDAIATIEWLEAADYPQNEKLIHMQGKSQFTYEALLESDVWRQAHESIKTL
jgi:beta-N-acetylhexosaminidase